MIFNDQLPLTTSLIVFFVCFRECLETTIIVSVLLSFLKQSIGPDKDPILHKKVQRQVCPHVRASFRSQY